MIWTDSYFVTSADLLTVDPDIQSTAESQDMNLASSIQRGIEEAGLYLEGKLVSFATYVSSNDLSSNHLAAVFYTGSQPNQRRRATLEQIVVSGRNADVWSELKQWAVNRVLIAFYLAASNRAQGDRYEDKLTKFQTRDVNELWPRVKLSGIPLLYRPMPAPAAVQGRDAGTWTASAQALVGGTATGEYDVAVTYVDESKYISAARNGNAESNPSASRQVSLTSTPGNGIMVDISNLNPPTGEVDPGAIARGFTVPLNATGWNIWAGVHGQRLYLQTVTPVPIAAKQHALTADPIASGRAAYEGQYPEQFMSMSDMIQRG